VKLRHLASFVVLCACAAFAQSSSPLITVAPISTITVVRGGKAALDIPLRVNQGFHVNSNHPNDELLLPTIVHLDPPEGIMIAGVEYPQAEQMALPFAGEEKLSVFSGDIDVTAEVRVLKSAPLGTQRVHGQVRYQACDNRRCFPPKTAPVEFDVKVISPPKVKRHTFTPASPHIR
jgi:cytochrome c biogenesis DsbD-like protein